jgi:hypothetical protein
LQQQVYQYFLQNHQLQAKAKYRNTPKLIQSVQGNTDAA